MNVNMIVKNRFDWQTIPYGPHTLFAILYTRRGPRYNVMLQQVPVFYVIILYA